MIRMIQSQSAKQAKAYFNESFSQSGYYLNDQELPGEFHGRIAKRMGLGTTATKEAFQLLCDNRHPITKKQLTPRNKQNRTVGYDINFHVPKSVSVLHVLSKDNHILDAFKQSMHDTMMDIEKDASTTIRKNGQIGERKTGELLWGEFIHQTARPTKSMVMDMHLHGHCYVVNCSFDKIEKRYKAGQFQNIKASMPYYQAMFHKRLSDSLLSMGYSIRRTKNAFEIIGVPENIIHLFSKRTNEIGQLAKENNITNAKELDALGARSRGKKQRNLTLVELKKEWRKQIIDAGMQDGDGSGQPIRHAPGRIIEQTTSKDCINHALDHRFERASIIQDRRILETAFRFSIGKTGATIKGVHSEFKADKRILKIRDRNKTLCTTKDALAEEKRMVDLAVKGKGRFTPLYKNVPELSATGEHAEAIRHILTTTSLVSIISGKAGTGKTTLMKEAVAKIEATGKKVIVVAPTAQASRGVLRDEGFKDAETVAKLLTCPELQKRVSGNVIWVDESGLLGTKDMATLLQLATNKGARIILSGDYGQHTSIVRGDAQRILSSVAGIKAAEISRIYRQKPEQYRQAVEAISQGHIAQGFKQLAAMNAFQEVEASRLADTLARDYLAASRGRKTALVVSPTHEQGRLVTDAIRKQLKNAGQIGKRDKTYVRLDGINLTGAEKADVRNYQPGAVIQFSKDENGFRRGSRWTITGTKGNALALEDDHGTVSICDPQKLTASFDVYRKVDIGLAIGDQLVLTRNGTDADKKRLNNGQALRIVSLDKQGTILARNDHSKASYKLPADYSHLNHAYCVTSHASQGKTVSTVLIAQPAATFPASDAKQFYVSVSRGRDAIRIYTDDKEALLNHVTQDGNRLSAMELMKKKRTCQVAADYFIRTKKYSSQSKPNTENTDQKAVTKVRSYEFKPQI
jgi:conjugative relaxase-like TrwC/TraI family protein